MIACFRLKTNPAKPMTLLPPFCISARLAPALKIGDAWLSFDKGQFVIDLPDGSEHTIKDYYPGLSASRSLPLQFADILFFLFICAESRSYGQRTKGDPMAGENSDLFPENVGQWAESASGELSILQQDIEESETDLIED